MMQECLDRLWKIEKVLEILYNIFSKVYGTSKDQAAEKFVFPFKGQAVFQTMYFQEIQMFWHENIQTVQLHWLRLQHQSVLEEGQTLRSPTADSNTCHSDVTACGNKGMSSQIAYKDFLLFPSTI
jgi:hypothetical protein